MRTTTRLSAVCQYCRAAARIRSDSAAKDFGPDRKKPKRTGLGTSHEEPRKITKAVFPVAGLGTRFLPATKSIPKEIMTLVDRPLIQYAIDEARAAGIKEFIFVTSRGKSALEDYFDTPRNWKAELRARTRPTFWIS
jgi:hypothetical protein